MADSIGEAVRSANAELTANHDKGESHQSERPEPKEPKAARELDRSTERPDDDDFGAPKWTQQWKKPTREKLRQLAKLEGASDLLPDVYKEIEERYDYSGKTQAEYDRLQKRWGQYQSVLEPLEQRSALQGMSPQAALQQMVAVSDMLQRDPDQGLAWILQNVKPRDAQKLFQMAAQTYGIDPSSLVQNEEWIDPVVAKRQARLEHQLAQQQNMMQQWQSQQIEHARGQVANALQAFANAKNDDGSPKYPHRERLDPIMAQMVAQGDFRPLEQLYEDAMWRVPELREELVEEKARRAEARAIQDAKHQNASVEEAQKASRNVNGGTKSPVQKKETDLRKVIEAQHRKLTNR